MKRALVLMVVMILVLVLFPSLAQAETLVTNDVTTSITGPGTATTNQSFTITITFETSSISALYATAYPTLAAPINLSLANVSYTSQGISPTSPENNYTISDVAIFDADGVTNLYSPWQHTGYCPVLLYGDRITWDYSGFVPSQPGDYVFSVEVSGLFWGSEGSLWIDSTDPIVVTHTVTVSDKLGQQKKFGGPH